MTVLIIDDNATNLVLLRSLAESVTGRAAVTMEDPVDALAWCQSHVPVLVVVDYRMPHVSGVEFIEMFRRIPAMASIPIIMVTTENEREVRKEALKAGATDFLGKPVDTTEFRLRVRNLLALSQAQALLSDKAKLLQHEVALATAEVRARESELVTRLARAAEFRDPETGAHILRMARYSHMIARVMGTPDSFQAMLLEAAPMHDVGKLAVPDAILLKPGRLDPDELVIMREHAAQGAAILAGSDSPLLQMAEAIAASHHEKFDGSGYPAGLCGAAIPLAARIVAVADVFDALTSARPYKAAWSTGKARAFMESERGKHFCPEALDAFLANWDEVLRIGASTPDPDFPT